jgi:hypothetical protein
MGFYKPASVMYNITLKNIMRRVHPIKGFVYHAVGWDDKEKGAILAEVRAREGSQGRYSGCKRKGPGYDTLTERRWRFVPLWGLVVWLVYTPRRIDCRSCGPTVEELPWASGKMHLCEAFRYHTPCVPALWTKITLYLYSPLANASLITRKCSVPPKPAPPRALRTILRRTHQFSSILTHLHNLHRLAILLFPWLIKTYHPRSTI